MKRVAEKGDIIKYCGNYWMCLENNQNKSSFKFIKGNTDRWNFGDDAHSDHYNIAEFEIYTGEQFNTIKILYGGKK